MARVILNTMFAGGNLATFVRIGKALRTRGHEVVLITHAEAESKARENGFAFEAVDEPGTVEAAVRAAGSVIDPRASEIFYRDHILSRAVREAEAVARHRSDECVIVGRSSTSLGVRLASEKYGIPFVGLYHAPAFAHSLGATGDVLGRLSADMNRLRAELGLGSIDDFPSWLASGIGGIGTWPSWFGDDDGTWPRDLLLSGFMLAAKSGRPPAPAIEEALSQKERPVLITGGSDRYMNPEYFKSAIEGCRLAERRAIVVAPDRSLLPKILPASFMCVDYVEFADVFPRVGLVIHHGGISTCGDALAAGVPQLVMGAWMDRPDNAARLEHLGVATYLPPARWSASAVAAALDRLDRDKGVAERCRTWAARLLADGEPEERICVRLLEAAKSGNAGAVRPAAREATPSIDTNDERAERLQTQIEALSPVKRELFALRLIALQEAPRSASHPGNASALTPRAHSDTIPLSHLQRAIWEFERSHEGTSAWWNGPVLYRMRGALDVDALERATLAFFDRHDVLRAHLAMQGGEPALVIETAASRGRPERIDLSGEPAAERLALAMKRLTKEIRQPLGRDGDPLAYAKIVRLANDDHFFLFRGHHIVFDAGSYSVLSEELPLLYASFTTGSAAPPLPPLQYADFTAWLNAKKFDRELAYSQKQLRDATPLSLPVDLARSKRRAGVVVAPVPLADDVLTQLDQIAREERGIRYTVLLAAFAAFLADFSGQTHVPILSPFDARLETRELQNVVGDLANQVVLHMRISADDTFRDVVRTARAGTTEGLAQGGLPAVLVLGESPLDSPFARVVLNVFHLADMPPWAGLEVASFPIEFHEDPKVELAFVVAHGPNSIQGRVVANAELFSTEDATRIAEGIGRTLARGLGAPDAPITEKKAAVRIS